MDKFSSSLNFPSKPEGYKNISASQHIKNYNEENSKKISYANYCEIN